MSHLTAISAIILCAAVLTTAIPSSLLKDIKSEELNNRKVKRAQDSFQQAPADQKETFTASKRGGNLKAEDLPLLSEWDQRRYRQQELDADIPRSLYNDDTEDDGKTFSQYAKGFRFANRDQMDEAVQNAILKSEVYGDPVALNQYQYYGDDKRKRKRRNASRLNARLKRDTNDLTPEEILAILTLWETERDYAPSANGNYRNSLNVNDVGDGDDEGWLQGPVRPHLSERLASPSQNYMYQVPQQIYEKRGRWAGLSAANRGKRFMVAKRTPAAAAADRRNAYYTLNDLLGHQREPDLPVQRRTLL